MLVPAPRSPCQGRGVDDRRFTDLLRGSVSGQGSCGSYALKQLVHEVRLLDRAALQDDAAADEGAFCNSVCLSSWHCWAPG